MQKIFLALNFIGIHFSAYAVTDVTKKCTPQQLVMVQNPENKDWHLFVCDDTKLPRGFAKSELTALYNATKSEMDHQAFWSKVMGVKMGKALEELTNLPNTESYPWVDRDKNKPVLERMAELYKKYIIKDGPASILNTEMRDPSEYKTFIAYAQAHKTKKCLEQKSIPAQSTNGEITCYCEGKNLNRIAYSNFLDLECKEGKLLPIRETPRPAAGPASAPLFSR